MMCPCMVTYPHQGLPSDIRQFLMTGKQDNSPMDGCQHKSCTSILEIFSLHILQIYVMFPVLLIVIRHCTQSSYHLSELCSELGLILVSLHPIAVRLIQSMNVAAFKPLKVGWKTAVQDWHKQNPDKI